MRNFQHGSGEQMLKAFEDKYKELSGEDVKSSVKCAVDDKGEPINIWTAEFSEYVDKLGEALKESILGVLGEEHVKDVYAEADEDNIYLHLDLEIPFPLSNTRYNYDEDENDIASLKKAIKDTFSKIK